jgi:hypothetical protein
MSRFKFILLLVCLILILIYPKFPLFGVNGTFVSIRLEDILVGLLALVFSLTVIRNRFVILKKPFVRSIVLYWFVCLVATFFGIFITKTAQPSLGLLHTLRRIEYMFLFLIAYSWLQKITDLKFFTRVIIFISLLIALYGLGQQFLRFPIISTNNSEFSKGLALTLGPGARINSTFAGHYDLAAFCVFPLLLIVSLLPMSKHKPLLITIGLLVYWTMLLSASRITFVALIFSVGLLLVIIHRTKWLIPMVLLAVLGVVVTPQLRGRYVDFITNHLTFSYVASVQAQTPVIQDKAVDQVPDALKPAVVPEDRSFNIRLQAEWPKALRAFYKNPIIGSGFSSIGLAVDNEYLRILAESGILGFLAFSLIIIRFIKTSWPFAVTYQPNFTSSFIVAVSCFLISLLLGALFIDVFTASKIAMFSWAIMGLAERAKELDVKHIS